jgi:hypothetical protein
MPLLGFTSVRRAETMVLSVSNQRVAMKLTVSLFLLLLIVVYTTCIFDKHLNQSARLYLRQQQRSVIFVQSNGGDAFSSFSNSVGRRGLHTDFPVNVTINLELYYTTEEIASLLDASQSTNDVLTHFCSAVSEQVSICMALLNLCAKCTGRQS